MLVSCWVKKRFEYSEQVTTSTSYSYVAIVTNVATDGRGPLPGDIVRNSDFASVLRDMAEKGVTDGFYRGENASYVVCIRSARYMTFI